MVMPDVLDEMTTSAGTISPSRGIECLLEIKPLWRAFLYELGIADGGFEIICDRQTIKRGAGLQPELLQIDPCCFNEATQCRFFRHIVHVADDIITTRQEMRRPATADGTGAEACDLGYF